jgi:hypothetical protein
MEESYSDIENEKFIKALTNKLEQAPKNYSSDEESIPSLSSSFFFVECVQSAMQPLAQASSSAASSAELKNDRALITQQRQVALAMKLRSGTQKISYENDTTPHPARVKSKNENMKCYQCLIGECTKSYNTKQHLKAHVDSFHNKRVYSCAIAPCSSVFPSSHDRTLHTKKEHPLESKILYPFVCAGCSKSFSKQNYLTAHYVRCGARDNK